MNYIAYRTSKRSPILVIMIGDAIARGLGHLVPAMVSGELTVAAYVAQVEKVPS